MTLIELSFEHMTLEPISVQTVTGPEFNQKRSTCSYNCKIANLNIKLFYYNIVILKYFFLWYYFIIILFYQDIILFRYCDIVLC